MPDIKNFVKHADDVGFDFVRGEDRDALVWKNADGVVVATFLEVICYGPNPSETQFILRDCSAIAGGPVMLNANNNAVIHDGSNVALNP